jgi:CheY-like chemotaxis protein
MAHILVVEDEAVISMMVEAWLADLGHDLVGPASTIAAALKLIETGEFDAAIVDLSLDGKHTYKIADALRLKGIPFAWGTGYRARDIEPAYRDELIVAKPYAFDAFSNAVALLLSGPDAKTA